MKNIFVFLSACRRSASPCFASSLTIEILFIWHPSTYKYSPSTAQTHTSCVRKTLTSRYPEFISSPTFSKSLVLSPPTHFVFYLLAHCLLRVLVTCDSPSKNSSGLKKNRIGTGIRFTEKYESICCVVFLFERQTIFEWIFHKQMC